MKFSWIVIGLLAGAVAFTGCGGDSDSDGASTGGSTETGGSSSTNTSSHSHSLEGDYLDTGNLVFINKNQGWVTADTKDNIANSTTTLFHTEDAGKTWEMLSSSFSIFSNSLRFINSTDGYHIKYFSERRGLYYTEDKGLTWNLIDLEAVGSSDNEVSSFASNSRETVCVSGSHLYFIDNATHEILTNKTIESPDNIGIGGYNLHLSENGDIAFGIVGGDRDENEDRVYKLGYYSNGTWSYTDLNPEEGSATWSSKAMDFISDQVGYFTTMKSKKDDYGRLYKTTNGGKTWSEIQHYTDKQISSIDFIDEQNGVGREGQTIGRIFMTTNGGKTWEKSGLSSAYMSGSIAYPEPGHVYVSGIDDSRDATVVEISN